MRFDLPSSQRDNWFHSPDTRVCFFFHCAQAPLPANEGGGEDGGIERAMAGGGERCVSAEEVRKVPGRKEGVRGGKKATCHTSPPIYASSLVRLIHQPIQLHFHFHMEGCIKLKTNLSSMLRQQIINYQSMPLFSPQ